MLIHFEDVSVGVQKKYFFLMYFLIFFAVMFYSGID